MRITVLDHGYIEYIEAWGTSRCMKERDFEVGIIEAARQSTQGSFRGWNEDAPLLKYLHDHDHATPFEFAGMVIEVQAPIFVFREWHRHRTQSYNEMSARYAPLPDLYYQPSLTEIQRRAIEAKPSQNKQASSMSAPCEEKIDSWYVEMSNFLRAAEVIYQMGLKAGVPKELARITMPVAHYSRMRASANLRNWLAFLTLRTGQNVQWETRMYAEALADILRDKFPRTFELWWKDRAVNSTP